MPPKRKTHHNGRADRPGRTTRSRLAQTPDAEELPNEGQQGGRARPVEKRKGPLHIRDDEEEEGGPSVERRATEQVDDSDEESSGYDDSDESSDDEEEPAAPPQKPSRGRPPKSSVKGKVAKPKSTGKAKASSAPKAAKGKAKSTGVDEDRFLNVAMTEAQTNVKQFHQEYLPPRWSDVDFDVILGKRVADLDENWTEAMEAGVQRWWADSTFRRAMESFDDKDYKPLLTLSKTCVRLHRRSPYAIISPARSMFSYGLVNRGQDGVRRELRSLMWSSALCDRSEKLVAHPFWRGKQAIDMIAAAIQFVVICRTDDRRGWAFDWPTESKILDDLSGIVRNPSVLLDKSVHEHHVELRKASAKRPSFESDLFARIGELAKVDTNRLLATNAGRPAYIVHTNDVTMVAKAIDGLRYRGFYYVPSVATAAASMMAVREGHGRPVPAEFRDFIERSCLGELRKQARLTDAEKGPFWGGSGVVTLDGSEQSQVASPAEGPADSHSEEEAGGFVEEPTEPETEEPVEEPVKEEPVEEPVKEEPVEEPVKEEPVEEADRGFAEWLSETEGLVEEQVKQEPVEEDTGGYVQEQAEPETRL